MKNLLDLIFSSPNGGKVEKNDNNTIKLSAKRPPIGEYFCLSNPLFTFETSEKVEIEEYIVIEYSCFGILRPSDELRPAFISAKKGEKLIPLLVYEDLSMDRQKHTIVAKSPVGTFDGIVVNFKTDKVLECYLDISDLYTCKKCELPFAHKDKSDIAARDFSPIDLSCKFNAEYDFDSLESVTDSGVFFNDSKVTLYGIPFEFSCGKNNIISPDAPPSENDEIIDNFGAKCKRRICRPISRDCTNAIEINKKATEIFFVLTLSGKRHERCLYGSNPVILGQEFFDINEPLKVCDTQGFLAEVVYCDGTHDTHLPLNLHTNRHAISGDIGVYGIPCPGKDVKELIIHNRLLDTDVNIAAVTVNDTQNRLFPDMLIPEKLEKITHEVDTSKEISVENNILNVKNGAVKAVFDISKGLHLISLYNAFTPYMKTNHGAVLKLRDKNGDVFEDFKFEGITCNKEKATVTLNYNGAVFEAEIGIETKDSISFNLNVKNTNAETFQKGIMFPCLPTTDFGSFSDNRYFLPKYQNTDSNETIFMYEESSPSFPLQFMDIYSPKMQGGLCLLTKERELITRKYGFNKDDNGMEMYIEYPYMYGDIAENQTFTPLPVRLQFTTEISESHLNYTRTGLIHGMYPTSVRTSNGTENVSGYLQK